jgi:hypothetical protein
MAKKRFKKLAESGKDPEILFKNRFNTRLSKKEKEEFNKWAKSESNKQGRDILMDIGAYDLQGFWKFDRQVDEDNHSFDTWKKPNHPKFSDESIYSGKLGNKGGKWDGDGFIPSNETLELYGEENLQRYFSNEPNRPEFLKIQNNLKPNTPNMKKKSYRYGTGNNSSIKNYLETPAEALAENSQNIAQAQYEGNSNPFYIALKTLGNIGMQAGMAAGGTGSEVANSAIMSLGNIEFEFGGTSKGEFVNVEGKEVVDKPNGKKGKKVQGPSHAGGGVDMFLPEGSNVFSDKIKVAGQTMAERKTARDNKLSKIESRLNKSPSDKILQSTLKKTKSSLDLEEEKDLQIQSLITQIKGGNKPGEAEGGINGVNSNAGGGINLLNYISGKPSPIGAIGGVPDELTGVNVPDPQTKVGLFLSNLKKELGAGEGGMSGGDMLGISGNMFSSIAPYLNTLKNRAGDTPNVNSFENFGQDALSANDQSQTYVKGQKDNALMRSERGANTARRSGRNSARGVNTMRALNLATEQNKNIADNAIFDNFSKQMMQLLGQRSGLENLQDQAVMGGEQGRDLADRQDRDIFYTNLAKNLTGMGEGIQQTGKDLNQTSQNEIMMNMLNMLSENFGINKKGINNKKN